MLRQYNVSEEVIIPYSDNRYKISINGIVTDQFENKIISDSTDFVEIILFGRFEKRSIALLMAISFKTMYKAESFVLNWKILFVDGNSKNIHPKNLIWQPPLGSQECPEIKGYYVIPGFTAFAINLNGEVYGRKLERMVNTRTAKPGIKNSYANFTTRTDSNGKATLGAHRALGLAFLPYSSTVWKMTVNHKDGVKSNNLISNLEWATYSENNLHAKDSGLNNTRLITLLKDHYSGDIIEFISLSHAAEYLEMNSGWLLDCIRNYPNKTIQFRYSAQFASEPREWFITSKEELEKKKELQKNRMFELECMAKNIFTKDIFIASGPGELGQLIKMTKDQTKSALDSPYPWPVNNYVFNYLNSPKEELVFKPDELIAFTNRFGIKNPVRVTKSDGSTMVYVSPSEFSVSLNLPAREIADKIYASKGKYITDSFCVEYIKA